MRPARPGERLRISASWYNNLNKRETSPLDRRNPQPQNPVMVTCLGEADVDLNRFDAASITRPMIEYEDFDGSAVQYESPSTLVSDTLNNKWGILQGPCSDKLSSRLVVLGVTWANFTYTSGHTHVDVVGGALTSGTSGKALILSPPESTGLPGLILIGSAPPPLELRISGLNFQLSRDGGDTWETWATGGECP